MELLGALWALLECFGVAPWSLALEGFKLVGAFLPLTTFFYPTHLLYSIYTP